MISNRYAHHIRKWVSSRRIQSTPSTSINPTQQYFIYGHHPNGRRTSTGRIHPKWLIGCYNNPNNRGSDDDDDDDDDCDDCDDNACLHQQHQQLMLGRSHWLDNDISGTEEHKSKSTSTTTSPSTMMSRVIYNNTHITPPRRCFSSSSSSSSSASQKTEPLIFHYGNDDKVKKSNGDTTRIGTSIRLSGLSPRRSAELEDELFSKLNNADGSDDDRLVDPILGKVISRKGLDWIRSVSMPSSLFSLGLGGDNDNDDNDGDVADITDSRINESITVMIQPPTLLHPKLPDIASNVAQVVQQEMASFIRNKKRSQWFEDTNLELLIPEEDICVTVKISPREITTPSISSSNTDIANQGKALANITHFLAVYSCKGGVGKSTIAANLAYQLASNGGRVGLLDLDVYGPSLPLLVHPDDPTVRQSPPNDSETNSNNTVEPITHRNVKLMSLGYVSPTSGVPGSGDPSSSPAAVLRGPMAGRVASQLLKNTNWGNLDVLVLDLPPGTGDVQLEVCQSLSLAGAVAVSTPSKLAWADARKGVQMFGEMGVATLALVENMAYFVCEGGGRHYPFGRARAESSTTGATTTGSGEEGGDDDDDDGSTSAAKGRSSSSSLSTAERFLPTPSRVFRLPISTTVNDSNDSGAPLCVDRPDGAEEELETFAKLADAISADLLLLQHGGAPSSVRGFGGSDDDDGDGNGNGENINNVLSVVVDEAGESVFDLPFTRLSVDNGNENFTVRLFSNEGGYQKVVSGRELRCRDPRSGEIEEIATSGEDNFRSSSMVQHHAASNGSTSSEQDGLFPAKVTKKGNYGYEVEWADGATIIYSLLAIAKAAGGKLP